MKSLRFVRSFLSSCCAVVSLGVVCFLVLVFIGIFRASHRRGRQLARVWGRFVAWCAGVQVRVEGGEGLRPGQPYIFAANHQSQFDIPVLAGFMQQDFCWMAKQELFKIPFFGRAMRTTGFISVDRSHGRKALRSLTLAAQKIADGTSVIIFPEGTRSPDGRLREFKSGAMVLAMKAGVPLVPVAISGTHDIVPKGSLLVRSGEVIIRLGEPIETSGYTTKQKQELAQDLYQSVAVLLEPENRPAHSQTGS